MSVGARVSFCVQNESLPYKYVTVEGPVVAVDDADTERDLSAWLGNAMQSNAIHELYRMEKQVRATQDRKILQDWRRMQTSDHFYYMCTKYFADGDVHKYFNPYSSPYDAYINYQNVLADFEASIGEQQ